MIIMSNGGASTPLTTAVQKRSGDRLDFQKVDQQSHKCRNDNDGVKTRRPAKFFIQATLPAECSPIAYALDPVNTGTARKPEPIIQSERMLASRSTKLKRFRGSVAV